MALTKYGAVGDKYGTAANTYGSSPRGDAVLRPPVRPKPKKR